MTRSRWVEDDLWKIRNRRELELKLGKWTMGEKKIYNVHATRKKIASDSKSISQDTIHIIYPFPPSPSKRSKRQPPLPPPLPPPHPNPPPTPTPPAPAPKTKRHGFKQPDARSGEIVRDQGSRGERPDRREGPVPCFAHPGGEGGGGGCGYQIVSDDALREDPERLQGEEQKGAGQRARGWEGGVRAAGVQEAAAGECDACAEGFAPGVASAPWGAEGSGGEIAGGFEGEAEERVPGSAPEAGDAVGCDLAEWTEVGGVELRVGVGA